MRIRLLTQPISPHHLHQRRCSCLSLPLMMWTQLKLPRLYTLEWKSSFKKLIVQNTTREENVHQTIELFFVMRRPYIWRWCRSWVRNGEFVRSFWCDVVDNHEKVRYGRNNSSSPTTSHTTTITTHSSKQAPAKHNICAATIFLL